MNKKLHKIGGLALAVMMATTIALPSTTSAQSISELQALITQLQAQINALMGNTTSVPSFTYTRDLTLGSTGADVIALQTYLEAKGMLTIPAGVSKGYFGLLTKSALARYQASVGIAPAVGYFGPITRAKVNVDSANGSTTTPGGNTNTGTNDLKGGEASLEDFDFSTGNDSDIKEGKSAQVAEIEFDVEDGDVRIDRLDFRLVADNSNDEKDPWDVFDSIKLIVDGKTIASADLDDEDDYLDEDDGTFRLSNINHIVREGKTAKIAIELTTQNSVDGVDSNSNATWTINIEDNGIRATDSEGIQQYIGDDSETVDFNIENKGFGEELNVKTSSSDPDSTTFKVEDDKRSDEHEIFVFELEGEEEDIEIDTVQVQLESDVQISNLVSDLTLNLDGKEYTRWSYVGTGTSTRVVEFDVDKDYTLDADDQVEVAVLAKFKAANGSNYTSGATIQARVLDGAIEGEGSDDVESDGVATGEMHTLATEGIVLSKSSVKTTSSTQGQNDTTGIFTIEFEVEAFENDFYIAEFADLMATTGVKFSVDGPASSTVSATLASTADEDTNGVFTVREGETETFTLTVTVDPTVTGQYRVALNSIFSTENSDGTTGVSEKTVKVTDYRTGYRNINN